MAAPDDGQAAAALLDLSKTLSTVRSTPDELSFGGSAPFLPSIPGLLVEGVGSVAVPLVDVREADKLIGACDRTIGTPDGTSMRSSWMIDYDKIRFKNPDWITGIQKTATVIAEKLGVAGTPITLQLRHLMLQTAGDKMATHPHARKGENALATFIVQLPSVHEGGQLQVFKNDSGNVVPHDFGAAAGNSAYQCHYAVYLSDSQHVVCPVTEGYRLALVYSVLWPTNHDPPPQFLSAESDAFAMQALARLSDGNRDFRYHFEHTYTFTNIKNLGVIALIERDRARVGILQTMNAALPPQQRHQFYLAHGKRHGTDHVITTLRSLDGEFLARVFVKVDEKNVLNPDGKTKAQRWSDASTTPDHRALGRQEFPNEKYLLLSWPAHSAEDRMIAFVGIKSHLCGILSPGADPDAVRKVVQRIKNIKNMGLVKMEEEIGLGRGLFRASGTSSRGRLYTI